MTAVDWLIKELKDFGYYTYNLEKLCEQAKEMEKQQQDEFAIGFAKFSINYNYHPMHKVWIKYDKMANEIFSTKELLEIYKKEQGL